MPPSVEQLEAAVRLSWAEDTSAVADWSETTPSRGQCAVTALVVQDYLGGELIRGLVDGVSHYWNRLARAEVDLTRDQFPRYEPSQVTTRSRTYILSFPDTELRYERLKERVAAILARDLATAPA